MADAVAFVDDLFFLAKMTETARQTGVELTLETRGAEHAEGILAALREAGYGVQRLGGA